MHLIEEQTSHRSEINDICKEKEQLKTQFELQDLEIGNLLERCKLLESGNIKLKEPQELYNSHNKSKCNTPTNRISELMFTAGKRNLPIVSCRKKKHLGFLKILIW